MGDEQRAIRFRPGAGGWVRMDVEGLPGPVFARLEERDGRFVIVEVHLAAEPGGVIDTNDLRRTPLGQIDAAANSTTWSSYVRRFMGRKAPAIRRELEKATPGNPQPVGPPLATVRRIERPDSRDLGDDFYRQVAEMWSGLKAAGMPRAAELIASWNDVPVTTVRRWVKEARARGFLPRGRATTKGS